MWKAQFLDKKKFILQEIEICLLLDNDNIIKTYEVFEDNHSVHFVLDLIEGGDLFDFMISSTNHMIPESRAQEFFYQILDSLQYLHSKNIIHRDIKPENFLIYHEGAKLKIKLIDFGFAAILNEGEKLNEKVGSLQYIAPEILLDKDYDHKIDMWAAGVVLFNMLSGKQPFFGKTDIDLINSVLTQEPVYNPEVFKNFHSKALCSGLLNKNPDERFSANQAKVSMWIQNYQNMELEPTRVDRKFEPKTENIKNILDLLNAQSSVKTEVWTLLLSYLGIDLAEAIKNQLIKNYAEEDNLGDSALGGKYTINYEALISEIVYFPYINNELKEKLNSIFLFLLYRYFKR